MASPSRPIARAPAHTVTPARGPAARLPAASVSAAPVSAAAPSSDAAAARVQRLVGDAAGTPWKRRLFAVGSDLLGGVLVAGAALLALAWGLPAFVAPAVQVGPLVLVLMVAALGLSGLYSRPLMHPAVEMQKVAVVVTVVATTAVGTTLWETGNATAGAVMGAAGLLAAVALPVCRGLSRVLVARTQWWRRPAVVLGTDPLAASVVDTLDRWPELGLRPVALLRAGADAPIPASGGPPVLGDFTAAPALALRHGIRHAVLAAPDVAPERRARLLSRYAQYFDQVMDVSDAHRGQVLWQLKYCSEGLVGTEVRHYALRRSERAVKRAIDLIGAGLALVLGAPLMAAAALLVRLDSPGPVFFRQQRMGRDGRCFPVLKFRTMHVDADERLEQILRQDPERREQYERYHKLTDDPRVTRIGRLLRRYSIDELPQLINVLRGEMSLVGPRAYMPRELPKMKRLNPVVLQTPPGITGLWQVSGRNAVSFERRVDLDVHYILNWSPWLDLYLLVRTLPVVLTGQGAR